VLAAIRRGGHPTVEELAAGARRRLGTVSTQAVYDVLGALAAAGLVRRIEPPGGPARFEGRVGDNHHHLVCRACGAVQDIDCAAGSGPCLELPAATGYEIDAVDVIFRGLCPECSGADGPRNRSSPPHDPVSITPRPKE
jgi:Fur family ferric uptake transcriptional regulator